MIANASHVSSCLQNSVNMFRKKYFMCSDEAGDIELPSSRKKSCFSCHFLLWIDSGLSFVAVFQNLKWIIFHHLTNNQFFPCGLITYRIYPSVSQGLLGCFTKLK